MCVCPLPRLLITSGVIWTPYDWLNKFYSFYMAAVVVIGSGRGLRIEARRGNQSNKSKPALYKPLYHCNSSLKGLYFSNKTECFSYKGGCGICECTHIEALKRRAGLGYR